MTQHNKDMTLSGQIWRFIVFFVLSLLVMWLPVSIVTWLIWEFGMKTDLPMVMLGMLTYGSAKTLDTIFENRERMGIAFLDIGAVKFAIYTCLLVGSGILAFGLPFSPYGRTVAALVFVACGFWGNKTIKTTPTKQ